MNIFDDYPLVRHNTFGMEVTCAQFVEIEHPDDIREIRHLLAPSHPHYILGGGSNTLFTRHYNGTIVHPIFKGLEVLEENADSLLLRVAAGEEWDAVIQFCLQHNLYGLENLVGIPGLAGSAPVQNIGAYGVEVKDCIEQVEGYLTDTLEPFSLPAAACRFGYRDSIFKNELKGKCLITHVWFRLSKTEHYNLTYKALAQAMDGQELSLKTVTHTILEIRNSKLPDITRIGCAGSFFKNPIVPTEHYHKLKNTFADLVAYPTGEDPNTMKLAAGQLIEKAGWKGKRMGNAGVYPLQALVIVNYGNATPDEITTLYQQVIADVDALFQIRLTPEVNIL